MLQEAWLQEIYQGHLHPQSIEKTRHLRGHHIPSLELQSAQLARQLDGSLCEGSGFRV